MASSILQLLASATSSVSDGVKAGADRAKQPAEGSEQGLFASFMKRRNAEPVRSKYEVSDAVAERRVSASSSSQSSASVGETRSSTPAADNASNTQDQSSGQSFQQSDQHSAQESSVHEAPAEEAAHEAVDVADGGREEDIVDISDEYAEEFAKDLTKDPVNGSVALGLLAGLAVPVKLPPELTGSSADAAIAAPEITGNVEALPLIAPQPLPVVNDAPVAAGDMPVAVGDEVVLSNAANVVVKPDVVQLRPEIVGNAPIAAGESMPAALVVAAALPETVVTDAAVQAPVLNAEIKSAPSVPNTPAKPSATTAPAAPVVANVAAVADAPIAAAVIPAALQTESAQPATVDESAPVALSEPEGAVAVNAEVDAVLDGEAPVAPTSVTPPVSAAVVQQQEQLVQGAPRTMDTPPQRIGKIAPAAVKAMQEAVNVTADTAEQFAVDAEGGEVPVQDAAKAARVAVQAGADATVDDVAVKPDGRADTALLARAVVADAATTRSNVAPVAEGQGFAAALNQTSSQPTAASAADLLVTPIGGASAPGNIAASLQHEVQMPALHYASRMSAAEQVAAQISTLPRNQGTQFSMQLTPGDLGTVDVVMDFHKDGHVQLIIRVDNKEALANLQRDAHGLERSLQDLGLKTDSNSLQFSLRQGQQDQQEQREQFADGKQAGNGRNVSGTNTAEGDVAGRATRQVHYQILRADGGVDIQV
jgi:flagellar hook-length control protein FliK